MVNKFWRGSEGRECGQGGDADAETLCQETREIEVLMESLLTEVDHGRVGGDGEIKGNWAGDCSRKLAI